ncbi:hypothetical protein, conserved [Leishmania tarentolae]|uniref:J domain-containing protein n=1 Tax=Leishmania tarentolae TaxID=5689 RepID=A0A640KHS8_LEITA|nr:hypothetical protein, conserved [Leishmania tarentolae]
MLAKCSLFAQRRVVKDLVVQFYAPAACWVASVPQMAQQQQQRRCSFVSATPAAPSTDAGKGNYFHFFQISKHPDLDVAALQKKYHNLQRLVHPDQEQVQARQQAETVEVAGEASASPLPFACTRDSMKSSVDVSTYANAAYETLRTPYLRCRYLSRLVKAEEVKGSPLSAAEEEELLVEDDQRTMKAREVRPDAPMSDDFLMEMLAMNELIFASDSSNEGVRRQWSVLRFDLEDRAVGYFKSAVKSWDDGDMNTFHHIVHEWTYVDTALSNLKERMLE